jgi:iron complex transport system substrate-binding protein
VDANACAIRFNTGDRQLDSNGAAMRIVSLLASATEMVAALGCLDQLVGRSHECDYPPEVQALPVLSTVQLNVQASSAQIDAQVKRLANQRRDPEDPALRALGIYAIDSATLQQVRPDVILTQTQCEVCAVSERDVTAAIAHLTGLAPRVVSLSPYRLQDVWTDVLRVGEALGKTEEARALVAGYRQRLAHLQQMTASFVSQLGARPRVAVLEWLDPLMGAGNWTPEMVTLAGGEPVCATVGAHTPSLAWEALQAADPQVIVLAPCGFTLARTLEELPILYASPGWRELTAVCEGRVFAIDGNQYLNRSGPRLVESAELLARVIWGERMHLPVDERGWIQALTSVTGTRG